MGYKRLVVICFCIATLVIAVRAQDKPAEETIRVNTALVSVPVIVSDRDGRYIPDLKQEDFTILQDGLNQKIDFFSATEQPINIAVLIDTSGSTRDVLGDIKKAAERFIKLLLPEDRAMIISFDGSTHLLCPLTSDSGELKDGIKRAEIGGGGTAMRDAVMNTVRDHFKNVEGRKAIILLTDGKDNRSSISSKQLLNAIEESDVVVYPVDFKTVPTMLRGLFGPPLAPRVFRLEKRHADPFRIKPIKIRPPKTTREPHTPKPPTRTHTPHTTNTTRTPKTTHSPHPTKSPKISFQYIDYLVPPSFEASEKPVFDEDQVAWDYLNKLAISTGGRLYDGQATNFNVFGFVVEELRRQYRIGYYPPEESGNDVVHSIRVQVSHPDMVIRARSTYRPLSK